MLGGIREIMLISTPSDLPRFEALLGDGSQWGMKFEYCQQDAPNGLAEAMILSEEFVDGQPSCLILGDNIFYGKMHVDEIVAEFDAGKIGATVFGYPVPDTERYGIIELDETGRVISIEEKPTAPKSNLAVPGLYFYDSRAAEFARNQKPSDRGELEITDLNRTYMELGQLTARKLGRGIAWLDSGTHESLLESSNFIETIEKRQGLKIACPEEIAWRKGFISSEKLSEVANAMPKSPYREYCLRLLSE